MSERIGLLLVRAAPVHEYFLGASIPCFSARDVHRMYHWNVSARAATAKTVFRYLCPTQAKAASSGCAHVGPLQGA